MSVSPQTLALVRCQVSFFFLRREPLPRLHLLHSVAVDERVYCLLECESNLLLFIGAMLGALLGKPAGIDQILEIDWIAAKGNANAWRK